MLKEERAKRQDTTLESTGAEFLVLGHLLREGVPTYKTYHNHPEYDLIATNPQKNLSVRIQIKSRWATNSDNSFPIKKFGSEFIVFVALNCGYAFSKKNIEGGKKDCEIYVFPTELCKEYARKDDWGKLAIKKIPDYLSYKFNWDLIKKKLKFI
ncbi:MAG: hypothetical protein IAE93_10835 [Ignavibacteria bacterium]|nr:hypothetical protein [Ignavibacteria bacterium]